MCLAGKSFLAKTIHLFVLALAAQISLVQASDTQDDLYFSELPIVASASRLPQRLQDAPSPMTILDRDIIRASGARDLNDLLRLVPGFQTFPNNSDPTRVSYHGLTDEDFSPRVQVLIDGRSQYSPLFRSGVNWNLLPIAIEDIERIEVVRGTNSAAYGSNAFLGVINIITLDPALSKGFSVSTNQGNQGIRDYTLRTGGQLGDNGKFRFTYQQRDDNALNDRNRFYDAFRSRLFDLRTDFQISVSDALEVNLGQVLANMPQGKMGDPGQPIHDFSQSNVFLRLAWRHILSADSELSVRYAYAKDSAEDRFLAATGNQPTDYLYWDGSFYGNSVRRELEIQQTFRPWQNMHVAWGAGYRRDELQSGANFYGGRHLNRTVARLFGNTEWKPINWFTGNIGFSFDDDSLAGNSLSPRVSGNFHVSPENTVRIGYANATRTGSIFDYQGDRRLEAFALQNGTLIPASAQMYDRKFYGNPNMPSEKLESFELGYLGDWRTQRMSLDVRGFLEKIPNRLMQVERQINQANLCELGSCGSVTADFTTPTQNVRIHGVEYQARWQPFESTRFMLSQSYIHISSNFLASFLNDPTISFNSNLQRWQYLTEKSAPHLASSLLWIQQLPQGLEFSAAGYWQGKMKWTQNSESGAYTRIDARLAYPFHIKNERGEISFTVQSLNGAHGEFKAYGSPDDRIVDRRSWLSIRLDY